MTKPSRIPYWNVLICSLYYEDDLTCALVPGMNTTQWMDLIVHEWDDVDAIYTEAEVLGGE